ncbi:MAG: hypothetical protein PUC98_08165 [Clostridiales bacterium]|nr:hypothetical protein [Clostridiales bacterium]
MRNRQSIIKDIAALTVLAVFGLWVNRGIEIRGLYMDDLYMWSCYGEQSLIEFAFPIGTSTRFRPVYWLATYLQMMIVGPHIERFVLFNAAVNIAEAFGIYFFSRRLSENRLISGAVGVCWLASRFAYYQMGQALGLMETMAQAFALAILYLLYRFISSEESESRKQSCWYTALLLYFLLAFTHERYIALLPLFYLAMLPESGYRKRHRASAVAPAAVLVIIVIIRALTIGKAIPAGTGGTEVTDTFSLGQFIRYGISQILYILGINAGPEHLNGLTWEQTPEYIRIAVLAGAACILLLAAVFAVSVGSRLRKADSRDGAAEDLRVFMLFAAFAALCIACSSVTIRVEMRWIYVSFAAALLLTAYMSRAIVRGCAKDELYGCSALIGRGGAALLLSFCLISSLTNIYYRGYFDRLYFWPDQLRMNSLAGQTIEKYGREGVFGKNIYILENSYGMSDFYAGTFFKTFDPEKKAENTNVIFVPEADDIPRDELREDRAIVLKELPEDNAYLDITEELKKENGSR